MRFRIFIVTVTFLLSGCAKARPIINTDFVASHQMQHMEEFPFHKAWVSSEFNKNNYENVYIAPINTDYLREMEWLDIYDRSDEEINRDLYNLKEFAYQALREAFFYDPYSRFKLLDRPDEKTLIIEFALVELIPNKAMFENFTRAIGLIAWQVSLAARGIRSFASKSSVAFEARFRDGGTKEIVAMFADNEAEKASIFNIKGFVWYAHIESIIEEWARQFVQITNSEPDTVIADSPTFEIKPW